MKAPRLLFAMVTLASLMSQEAKAESTVCSDPSRARVLDTAVVALPTDGIDVLSARFDKLAGQLGMTTGGVVFKDEDGSTVERTLGLQSPKVSVSIKANWIEGQRLARLSIERTCYFDDLEPWIPYWRGLLAALRRAGYRVY